MSYVFPPVVPAVQVAGLTDRFPVHRIYCVGRNYADHAREMGADPQREPPFFFAKPADAVVPAPSVVRYPSRTAELHHEVELVVALRQGGANLTPAQALDCVYGYAVGIDLTRRDLQAQAKQAARPWDVAKGFDQSAPVSALHPVSQVGHPEQGGITLAVNGVMRQSGNLADMIWSVPEIIAELSTYFTLAAGDLIFTGTPAGVGAVSPGDELTADVAGIDRLQFKLTAA